MGPVMGTTKKVIS